MAAIAPMHTAGTAGTPIPPAATDNTGVSHKNIPVKSAGRMGPILCDGAAINAGMSATDLDMDDDGWSNAVERQKGTNPFVADTDGDTVNDSTDFSLLMKMGLVYRRTGHQSSHTPPPKTCWS